MADRSVALTTIQGGINRLRVKGAALNNSLYDLLNGFVTAAKTVKIRPGTLRIADLPQNTAGTEGLTKGLMSFDGALHVFSNESVDVPPGFVLHVLTHPDSADIPITIIHFAAPFLGFPYVVAEFEGGDIFHFWLQSGPTWLPDHIYKAGDIVLPSVPNGISFQATRISAPNLSWAPNVQRTIGDVIEPTVYNDFFYTVVDTLGDNPRSGTVEPIWPTEDGARINEDADGTTADPTTVTPPPDTATTPSPAVTDRYGRGPKNGLAP